jgi:hypothetical protein
MASGYPARQHSTREGGAPGVSVPRPRLARDLVAHIPGEMPSRADPERPGDEQALHHNDPIWHVGPNASVTGLPSPSLGMPTLNYPLFADLHSPGGVGS